MGKLMSTTPQKTANQGDLLLWIAGAAVAAVGIAWLAIMKPWAGGDVVEPQVTHTASSAPEPAEPLVLAMATPEPADTMLDNPLRMAQLAYDAGMLIEPEEYSAWTLYARAAKAEPGNAEAAAGLTQVADDLVQRGETALDQGRFDDARATVERIRAVLPNHPGAKALATKIWPDVAPQQPAPETLKPPVETPRVARVETPVPTRPVVDPVAEAGEAFAAALAAGRLLTPTGESAKHFADVLFSTDRDHDITRRARNALSSELLARAERSIAASDGEAAKVWIDEAETLGVDSSGILRVRTALNEHLIAMESAKPMPASALKIVTYVKPVYPDRALERGLEGWVDLEFTVGTDGSTRDVAVADASHDTFFRREAQAAVEKWRFEPRSFMGRAIEQRSYTRIRFVD
jgi:TonB family protein